MITININVKVADNFKELLYDDSYLNYMGNVAIQLNAVGFQLSSKLSDVVNYMRGDDWLETFKTNTHQINWQNEDTTSTKARYSDIVCLSYNKQVGSYMPKPLPFDKWSRQQVGFYSALQNYNASLEEVLPFLLITEPGEAICVPDEGLLLYAFSELVYGYVEGVKCKILEGRSYKDDGNKILWNGTLREFSIIFNELIYVSGHIDSGKNKQNIISKLHHAFLVKNDDGVPVTEKYMYKYFTERLSGMPKQVFKIPKTGTE